MPLFGTAFRYSEGLLKQLSGPGPLKQFSAPASDCSDHAVRQLCVELRYRRRTVGIGLENMCVFMPEYNLCVMMAFGLRESVYICCVNVLFTLQKTVFYKEITCNIQVYLYKNQ